MLDQRLFIVAGQIYLCIAIISRIDFYFMNCGKKFKQFRCPRIFILMVKTVAISTPMLVRFICDDLLVNMIEKPAELGQKTACQFAPMA